jgi:hypothetical protein
MGFRVDKEIKVTLETESGDLEHVLRLPTADEWMEYARIDSGETEVTRTLQGEDAQIKRRLGTEALEARVYLYDRCLISATGYEDADGEIKDTAKLKKFVPAPHKMAAAAKIIENVKNIEEKVKN